MLFVLPSLFMLIGLTWVYLVYRAGAGRSRGAVCGIKPAVTAAISARRRRCASGRARCATAWLWRWRRRLSSLLRAGPAVPRRIGRCGAGQRGGAAPQHFSTGRGHGDNGRPHAAVIDDDTPTPPHARFSAGRLLRVAGFSVALWALVLGLLVLLRAPGDAGADSHLLPQRRCSPSAAQPCCCLTWCKARWTSTSG